MAPTPRAPIITPETRIGPSRATDQETHVNHQQMLKPMLIGAGVLVVLAIAGVPVGNFAFLLVLLICPLMMFFMMRGMMDHGGSESHDAHTHAGHDRPDDR